MTEQIYSDHLKEYCKDSPIIFVKESESMVKSFFNLDKKFQINLAGGFLIWTLSLIKLAQKIPIKALIRFTGQTKLAI